jgi:hypothetical protein
MIEDIVHFLRCEADAEIEPEELRDDDPNWKPS